MPSKELTTTFEEDLASSGCPRRARLSPDPDDAEFEARVDEVVLYVTHIQNTGSGDRYAPSTAALPGLFLQ